MTENGKLLFDFIMKSHNHPTAEEIFLEMLSRGERMSMATVYNNLNALSEEGLIKKLIFDGKVERFDRPDRHDHLVCSVCGAVSDIMLEDLTDQLRKSTGAEIDGYDLKLFYVCEHCRRQSTPEYAESEEKEGNRHEF